jgi:hypothetical protein
VNGIPYTKSEIESGIASDKCECFPRESERDTARPMV